MSETEGFGGPAGVVPGGSSLEEWKRSLRWEGRRICRNCIHARELTFEEYQRYKNYPYGDAPNMFCEHPKDRSGHHPHATHSSSHCFVHEYDDDSVLLPKNPKWCAEGTVDLWPYERERRDAILVERNQISVDEVLQEVRFS